MKPPRIVPSLFETQPNMPELPPPSTAPKPRLRQGIYMLPTLFTVGNMALGFFSLIKTMAHEFSAAATAVIVAHVLDILDGRVARLTKTESKFGIELDSLADWISFGIAPAFMMYELVLKQNRLWGFPVALLFVICGGLRLARFNIKAHMGEAKTPYFVGLPIPAAGGMLAIFTLLYDILEVGKPVRTLKVVMKQVPAFYDFVPAIMFVLALLMVSQVRYSSLKQINLLRPRTMRALVFTLVAILMIYVYPQNTIFILYVSYIGWGMIDYFLRHVRKERPENAPGYQHDTYGK
ncbi:MAG TPA: CDP-diacylglycerol--serine O-phosphatidyltransferase [Elusimicrobiota bacterium]|nr:CDP-diacylglycerol--serine O-phosphatidyltransferase [Elusimicrobiota bacterium]